MESEPIYNESYLTEEEENSQDSKYNNFSNFISTQIRKNNALKDYLWELGWLEKKDVSFLEPEWIQHMYNLLDEKAKKEMKSNYLRDIRKIIHQDDFSLVGGKRIKKTRKTRKTRKSRKTRKTRKTRKSRN